MDLKEQNIGFPSFHVKHKFVERGGGAIVTYAPAHPTRYAGKAAIHINISNSESRARATAKKKAASEHTVFGTYV